jgi:methyl acetate hydrolase
MLGRQASVKSIIAPLTFEPGASFQYGTGPDWAGLAVQRVTGLNLDEYYKQEIYSRVPGGMPHSSFYPREDIKSLKCGVYTRDQVTGKLQKLSGYGTNRPTNPDDVSKTFHAGGGGLFSTTKDYLALLRAILQCDPRNPDPPADPLISKRSYSELFSPGITTQPGLEKLSALCRQENYFSPTPNAGMVNYSVGFCLLQTDSDNGRRRGSGTWAGMAHTQFWIDPETGLAVSGPTFNELYTDTTKAVCNTQIIGPNPDPWNKVYNLFERTLYDSLMH